MNKRFKIIQRFNLCLPAVGSYLKIQRLSSVANQHPIFESLNLESLNLRIFESSNL